MTIYKSENLEQSLNLVNEVEIYFDPSKQKAATVYTCKHCKGQSTHKNDLFNHQRICG